MKALQLFNYTANNFVKQDLFFGYDMLCYALDEIWNIKNTKGMIPMYTIEFFNGIKILT